jgi:hypothetical protein
MGVGINEWAEDVASRDVIWLFEVANCIFSTSAFAMASSFLGPAAMLAEFWSVVHQPSCMRVVEEIGE